MKIYFFLILFFVFSQLQSSETFRHHLTKISQQDKNLLTYLFRRLLFQEDFAYCLWGTKPIAIDDGIYRLTFWKTFPCPIYSDEGEMCYYNHAILTWRKNKHFFSSDHFILLDEEKDLFPQSIGIALINKFEFVKTVEEHLSLFKEVLGEEITGELLLNKIETGEASLKKALGYHEGLLGILLGYGKANALFFNEKIKFFKILERPTSLHFIYDHQSIKAKYEKLNQQLTCFSPFDATPSLVNPLYFAADVNHPETIALQKKYQKERVKITESYSSGNFLEITFAQLISYDSKP